MASALTDFYELSPARTLSWEEWQAEHFDALERRFESLSGPLADPDDDNRTNILEYGQATHPRRFDRSYEACAASIGACATEAER